MRRFYARILFFLLAAFTCYHSDAQVTITTSFTNNSSSGELTFNFENTNTTPVMITNINSIVGVTSLVNVEAWYKPTAINGNPGVISTANGWTQFGNGTISGVANTSTSTPQSFFNNLTLVIPPGATYGISVSAYTGTSTGVLRYSTLTTGSTIYTQSGNCNLINGTNIGYAGSARPAGVAPTSTPTGFIGDITFTYPPACNGVPTAGNTLSTQDSVCTTTSFTLSMSSPPFSSGIDYQWQSSPSGSTGTWSAISGATSSVLTTTQTSANYYRCQVTCGTNTVYSVAKFVGLGNYLLCICAANSQFGPISGFYSISNVTLNTLNNSSTYPTVSPYTTTYPAATATTTVLAGGSYTLSAGFGAFSIIRAWVDWDHDGNFSSSESYLIGSNNANGTATFSTTINVPPAAAGGLTRMRVRSNYVGLGLSATDACTTPQYGETEDYTISVTIPTPCSGTPVPGNTISSADSACSGVSFLLSLQNTLSFSGLTYQWQSSTDGITWSYIGSGVTLTTTQSTASYYRCKVLCTNTNDSTYSGQKFVSQGLCYCTPTYTGGGSVDYITNISLGSLNQSNSNPSSYLSFLGTQNAVPDLNKGQSYTLSVSMASDPNQYSGVWIDFNHDGSFATTEFFTAGVNAGANGTTNITIVVPTTALSGQTRLRVRGADDSQPTASQSCGATNSVWGQGQDYLVNLVSTTTCTGTPTPGTTLGPDSSCTAISFTMSLQNSVTTAGIAYQWQISTNGAGWSNITAATNSTYTTTQSAANYYRAKVICTTTNDSAFSTAKFVSLGLCYCIPTYTTNSPSDDISQVVLGSLTQASNNSAAYIDYTATQTSIPSLNQGQSYTVAITVNADPNQYSGVWIDFDHDAIFATGEYFSTATNAGAGGTANVTIVVPFNAIAGLTRMRIRGGDDVALSSSQSCGASNSIWGQAMDFRVNIVAVIPCSGTPVPGGTIASVDSACSGASFSLSLQNNSTASGLTYQWQSSANGTTWASITGATNNSYTASQTSNTYYRAQVTCSGGSTGTSGSLLMNMANPQRCYCTPTSTSGMLLNNGITRVLLNTLHNGTTSPTATPYFTLYAATDSTTTIVNAGSSYTLSVKYNGYTYLRAWIDWNRNGVFESTETYLGGADTGYGGTKTTTIPIPASAFAGLTRMRIRSSFKDSVITAADACKTLTWGETEDYWITINTVPTALILTDINAVNTGSSNNVTWKTAVETDVENLELQRSADGVTFIPVYSVSAKGKPSAYYYTDRTPYDGTNYYRLRITDKENGETYSKTVTANVKTTGSLVLEAAPNPFSGLVNLKVNGTHSEGVISVTDITGRLLQQFAMPGDQLNVNLKELAQGVYLIRYNDGVHTQTVRVVKN